MFRPVFSGAFFSGGVFSFRDTGISYVMRMSYVAFHVMYYMPYVYTRSPSQDFRQGLAYSGTH